MENLLRAAGAPESAIRCIPDIVDKCRPCRTWAKPTPAPAATSRLVEYFNALVQHDLLFRLDGPGPVQHIIDA